MIHKLISCRSRSSRSYNPSGLFKNTGFNRTSFRGGSFSKRNEQSLINNESNGDFADVDHSTFQMTIISPKKSGN